MTIFSARRRPAPPEIADQWPETPSPQRPRSGPILEPAYRRGIGGRPQSWTALGRNPESRPAVDAIDLIPVLESRHSRFCVWWRRPPWSWSLHAPIAPLDRTARPPRFRESWPGRQRHPAERQSGLGRAVPGPSTTRTASDSSETWAVREPVLGRRAAGLRAGSGRPPPFPVPNDADAFGVVSTRRSGLRSERALCITL